jgi:tRNA (guanine-N7-)-methyltransferase
MDLGCCDGGEVTHKMEELKFKIFDLAHVSQIERVESQTKSEQSVIIRPASYVERLNVQALFVERQPVEVELGAGDGSFLVQWAGMNPQINFLGVERLLGRLKKIDKKSRRIGLTNVHALRLEANYFAEYLVAPESVTVFHIYFPDPWPKRKHRQNRLINERFSQVLRTALMPGGVAYLRTDDVDYFAQMTGVFAANKDFESTPTPSALAAVLTDFEREFTARGIQTNHAAYRRLR